MPFIDLNEVTQKEIIPGYRATFVHADHMTLAYWSVDAGAPIPEHAHSHEQVVNMLEGRFELTVEGETRVLKPGTVVVIPMNAKHSGVAVTDCRLLDVFYPVREDYR